ncbi:MAG: hypothetical protein NTW10_11435, partial [Bacteroidetes bacterium]|nr:hypothetical protein [Bacteroidota bacterium]
MKKIILAIAATILLFTNCQAQTQIWGVTAGGGTHYGGTIFKIMSDGSGFQHLYSFDTITGSDP